MFIAFDDGAPRASIAPARPTVIEAEDLLWDSNDAEIRAGLRGLAAAISAGEANPTLTVIFRTDPGFGDHGLRRAVAARLNALEEEQAPGLHWQRAMGGDRAMGEFLILLNGEAVSVTGLHPDAADPSRWSPRPAIRFTRAHGQAANAA